LLVEVHYVCNTPVSMCVVQRATTTVAEFKPQTYSNYFDDYMDEMVVERVWDMGDFLYFDENTKFRCEWYDGNETKQWPKISPPPQTTSITGAINMSRKYYK
jgi:hypothetical protein